MAKLTIADVSQTAAVHAERIGRLEDDAGGLIDQQQADHDELVRLGEAMQGVSELRAAVGKLTEQRAADQVELVRLRESVQGYAELRAAVAKLTEQRAADRVELDRLRKESADSTAAARESDKATADLRQEQAVTRQQLVEHLKRVEVWDARRWALVAVLVSALLALASGLVVALARR